MAGFHQSTVSAVERLDEEFWALSRLWKRLTLRFAQHCVAEERGQVLRFARFQQQERQHYCPDQERTGNEEY